MIYFDNAATTKVFPEVLDKIKIWSQDFYANPNSIHSDGQRSRMAVEESRRYIASFLGVPEDEIIFTSCATESNNTIIRGLAEGYPEKDEILISPIEHKSVLNPVRYLSKRGYKIRFLKVDSQGIVDLDDLNKKITPKTLFVSIIHVNNETGVVQDLESIGKVCKERDVLFFSDTVQSFCKIDINSDSVDFFSVSGHKINAPKGIGFFRRKKDIQLTPLLFGGGQEFGLRSGTENVVYIKALSETVRIWNENRAYFIKKLKDLSGKFINGLKTIIPDVEIVSENAERSPNIITVIFPKIDAQTFIMALNTEGIAVSSGSACSSGTPSPSHVLLSYGYSEEKALRAVRFSFGVDNTEEEVDILLEKIKDIFGKLSVFY
ncbi:MAG TPA: cysteine desulfurase [Persephonella sp.]|uniref:cysteine desulfurase n=1 Tax=Persephonella marina (strain DSM 14350 / EX-H1) TaxID=123214 RepID=C0QTJ8_PERMH|nr:MULTISPECIES: cysteine desulfurase family protein [Persephonella]ACO02962.1 cysteine desulfurase (Nitrogenase metalloclustersbiosynthesis protein NifS) [Persephonella marina EX-H1]HCB70370.1 cysteine desulfurase [Persephonella sp.]